MIFFLQIDNFLKIKCIESLLFQQKGFFKVEIAKHGKSFIGNFIVIENGCRPLVGQDILKQLNFKTKMINC